MNHVPLVYAVKAKGDVFFPKRVNDALIIRYPKRQI